MAFILRWISCFAQVIDGTIGILTLGFVRPALTLACAKATAKARFNGKIRQHVRAQILNTAKGVKFF